jgi:hypothetical protein
MTQLRQRMIEDMQLRGYSASKRMHGGAAVGRALSAESAQAHRRGAPEVFSAFGQPIPGEFLFRPRLDLVEPTTVFLPAI